MMRPSEKYIQAFHRAPLMTRLVVLARAVVHGERGDVAASKLINLATVMAAMLSGRARLEIAAQLRDAAEMLAPPAEPRSWH
jgi:hypothetical protein